jgi:4-hydroxy-tetrahydrodipicolinate reductase
MKNNMPKIALVGYGAMGREVERQSKHLGYIITEVFDYNHLLKDNEEYEFDVAIDFSLPNVVMHNLQVLAHLKKNVVVGTTGWYDRKDEVAKLVENSGIGLVWGSNFSVGMQMYFRMVESVCKILNKIPDYDIMVHELHHKRKKDSPSGTALSIANIILKEISYKNKIVTEAIHGEIDSESLHVSSTRGGEITGTHSVYIDSLSDTIEIKHEAKNRSGFAIGSLTAASWIKGKSGFYEFNDVIDSII